MRPQVQKLILAVLPLRAQITRVLLLSPKSLEPAYPILLVINKNGNCFDRFEAMFLLYVFMRMGTAALVSDMRVCKDAMSLEKLCSTSFRIMSKCIQSMENVN